MIAPELKFRWAAKKLARAAVEDVLWTTDSVGGKFAVVLDSDDRFLWEKFQELKAEVKAAGGSFVILCLMDLKGVDAEVVPFSSGDLKWDGRIRNERVLDFFRDPYEVLLVFTAEPSPLERLVVQATRADLKIGREEKSSSLYDLSISARFEEVDLFLEEVKRYWTILKK